jgi:hypothetical protein
MLVPLSVLRINVQPLGTPVIEVSVPFLNETWAIRKSP